MLYDSCTISDRIKDAARVKGIKLQELYTAASVNPSVLYDMKKSYPKIDTLARLADCLDVSIDYLIGRTDKPSVNR